MRHSRGFSAANPVAAHWRLASRLLPSGPSVGTCNGRRISQVPSPANPTATATQTRNCTQGKGRLSTGQCRFEKLGITPPVVQEQRRRTRQPGQDQ